MFFRSCAAVSLSLSRSLVLSRYIPMHLPIQNYSTDLSAYFPGTDIPMHLSTYLPLPLYHSICLFFGSICGIHIRKDGRLMPIQFVLYGPQSLEIAILMFFFCQHSIPSSKKKIINTMRIGFSSGSPMKLNFEKVGVALQQDWMDIDHHWYWLNSNIDGSWWINGSPDQYDQCITGSLYICLSMFSHQVEPLDHRFLLQDRSFNGSPFNVSSPLRQLSREAGCFSKMPCYSFGILQNQTASSKFWIWFVYARYSNLLNYIPLSFIVYSI